MRLTPLALIVVTACSSKASEGGARRRAEPDVDPAVVARAASTRCLVNRTERYESDLDTPVLFERSSVVARAVAQAIAAVPRLPGESTRLDVGEMLSVMLADFGDVDGARAARPTNGASELPEQLTLSRDLRIGDDLPDDRLGLREVPTLVIMGQRDRAARIAKANQPEGVLTARDGFPLGVALGALGDRASLDQLIAAAPAIAGPVAAGWLYGAIVVGRGLAPAIDAVLAAPVNAQLEPVLIRHVVLEGSLRGHGPALAGLRAALRGRADGDDHDDKIEGLYIAALTGGGDDAELDALEAALTDRGDRLARMKVERVIYRGTLDEGLDAVIGAHGPAAWTTGQLGTIWGRHVHAGFDRAFEDRLAAAACVPGCLIDRAAGASVRVTAAGALVGDDVVIPAGADRAAAAKALTPGQAAACGLGMPDRATLTIALTPSAKADVALTIAGGALDAGFASATLIALPSADDATFAGAPCVIERAPPRAPPDPDSERVVLSLLVQVDRIWIGQSRINEFQPVEPGDHYSITAAALELGASSFFQETNEAELATEPGVPATELVRLASLCQRFPKLHLLSRDELTAKPTL